MNYKQLFNDVLRESELNALPSELMVEDFHIWSGSVSKEKDWDDFIGGQLVNHCTYVSSFKGAVDNVNLEFGSSAQSFYSLLKHNTTIELYADKYIDLDGKFVSIGTDLDKKYLAISIQLKGFKFKKDKIFMSKIILVDIAKRISEEMDTGEFAPTINFVNGGDMGTDFDYPEVVNDAKNGEDGETTKVKIKRAEVWRARYVEFLFTKPTALLGIDFFEKGENRPKKYIKNVNTKPTTFPINNDYCIVPAQFNIPSFDNYGKTHPLDHSNVAKVLAASQTISQVSSTGMNVAGILGSVGKKAIGIGSASLGLATKMFGDKGTLANSGAIVPQHSDSVGDGLKLFIQGDSMGLSRQNIDNWEAQDDYIEINQANGEFGKFGKPMSPINNGNFDDIKKWRALGLSNIDHISVMPLLCVPYPETGYTQFKITKEDIDLFLQSGCPRKKLANKPGVGYMFSVQDFPVYIRNMYFRPDPYQFWNWPVLLPSEVGIYGMTEDTGVSYDINPFDGAISTFFKQGTGSNKNSNKLKSHWSKTISLKAINDNDIYDPNKTFTSLRYEFLGNHSFHQIHISAFTSSTIQVNFLNYYNEVVKKHIFNSQGKNMNNPASIMTILEL